MGLAVDVRDLRKNFGDFEALKGTTFKVDEGEIYGLIGPNGAGKTTTLRILGTLIGPTSGVAEVFGHDVVKEADKIREILSYLPEDAGAYQYLTGEEYLRFMAGFYAHEKTAAEEMVKAGKEISGLGDRLTDRVNGYSRGMKRRLLIARALMIKPKLAILDEPTSGLDVIQAYHVRGMIKDYAEKMGVTILVSSHNMLEVEYLCHRVALINEGTIISEGTPEELKARYNAVNLEQAFMEATQLG
ncbi:MAG: ABC transporter ATP-binding protein [Candidatus Bathyarchaeota archaeon]|nr:ABC transporter ATP-binding protein [Candidatus Bathyarchaeota archaeon]